MRIILSAIFIIAGLSLSAQSESDLVLTTPYHPDTVLAEWVQWYESGSEPSFIAEFFTAHAVPLKAQYSLTLYNTWLYWMSQNPAAMLEYLDRKQRAMGN